MNKTIDWPDPKIIDKNPHLRIMNLNDGTSVDIDTSENSTSGKYTLPENKTGKPIDYVFKLYSKRPTIDGFFESTEFSRTVTVCEAPFLLDGVHTLDGSRKMDNVRTISMTDSDPGWFREIWVNSNSTFYLRLVDLNPGHYHMLVSCGSATHAEGHYTLHEKCGQELNIFHFTNWNGATGLQVHLEVPESGVALLHFSVDAPVGSHFWVSNWNIGDIRVNII